jgi:1-phosphofructokinase
MNGPIVTVTLNPALDQTVALARLQPGEVNIAHSVTLNAGGKGVNVAGCLADWGAPVLATGILGRDNAAPFEALFADKGIGNRFVLQPGSTRINIKVISDDDGATTDINLPGPALAAHTYAQLLEHLDDLSEPGRFVVLAGSLPAGLDVDTYAKLSARLTQQGARVLLDTSGAALCAALAGAVLPFCIKPNLHELEQWAGHALATRAEIVGAARALHRQGVQQVVVSLAEQGALFIGRAGAWLATPPPITPISSVGAGDALVAGWLAAQHQGRDWQHSIRLALAFAAGKLAKIGPHLPAKDEVEQLAHAVTLYRLPD